jgi:heat shock protein HspQ
MSTFTIGQTVHHRKFGYRGVVMGVDEAFQGSDEWYDQVARSRPPKDKPWVADFFDRFRGGVYSNSLWS